MEWGSRVKFDVTSIPDREKVTGAELRLRFNKKMEADGSGETATTTQSSENVVEINDLDLDSLGGYSTVRVLINDVIKPPRGSQQSEPIMHPIDSKLIDLTKRKDDSFWVTLDVFPAVSRWIQNPKKNHGLVIQIVHPNGQVMTQAGSSHVRVRRDVFDERYDLNFENTLIGFNVSN